MRSGLFRYKVFRQKVVLTIVEVMTVALLLSALSTLYYLSLWKDTFRTNSVAAFQSAESSLQHCVNLMELQMNRVYSHPQLMLDLRAVLNSGSQEEYFAQRFQNSMNHRSLIRSFPKELDSYLFRQAELIRYVTITGERFRNWISTGDSPVLIGFNMEDAHDAPDIGGCIEVPFTIYDPDYGFAPIGQIGFWVDIVTLINRFPHDRGWFALFDEQGDLLYISRDDEVNRQTIEKFDALDKGEALLPGSTFSRSYIVTIGFLNSQYKVYACVTEWALAQENMTMLMITYVVFFLLGAAFSLIGYHHLKQDARFLDDIFHSINAVKRGEFFAVKRNTRTRNNEYDMIAEQLNDMSHELQVHIIAGMQLKIKQQDAEMRALQHQINPHFLNNTLEVIRSLSLMANDTNTANAIAALGAIYRNMMKSDSRSTISDELQLLEKYLKLMSYRYCGNFYSQITVDTELLTVPTVKFWMQPLAENFFIHGFNSHNPYNLLIINGQTEQDGYLLEIVDNGITLSEETLYELNASLWKDDGTSGTGIGLSNVSARLRYFYGERFRMKIKNNLESGVCIALFIPEKRGGISSVYPADCG